LRGCSTTLDPMPPAVLAHHGRIVARTSDATPGVVLWCAAGCPQNRARTAVVVAQRAEQLAAGWRAGSASVQDPDQV